MSDGKGKPPSGKPRHIKKPIVARHAHDEFEIDIDLETDFTELASRPTHGLLFEDEEEVTNEISQEELATVTAENSEVDNIIPKASDEKILPMFISTRSDTPSKPFSAPLGPEVVPPDLSDEDNLGIPPGSTDISSSEDLFGDVSGIHDEPPIHDLHTPKPYPLDGLHVTANTDEQTPSKKKFSKGFTAGMAPLDVTDFSASAPKKSPSGRKSSSTFIRRGPAPMAHSNRVVRRWYQPNVRDILLFLLVVLLGIGIWVGWNIYQDYKRTIGWERFDQGRMSIEQARVDAIKSTHPEIQRDVP